MVEDDLFNVALNKVDFLNSNNEISIMMFSTFEVNFNDVRFRIDKKKRVLTIYYPSDNLLYIDIKDDEILNLISEINKLKIIEIDIVSGSISSFYHAYL